MWVGQTCNKRLIKWLLLLWMCERLLKHPPLTRMELNVCNVSSNFDYELSPNLATQAAEQTSEFAEKIPPLETTSSGGSICAGASNKKTADTCSYFVKPTKMVQSEKCRRLLASQCISSGPGRFSLYSRLLGVCFKSPRCLSCVCLSHFLCSGVCGWEGHRSLRFYDEE